MPFEWIDFLQLAATLEATPSANAGEALWRTVASRAYYACFHAGLAVAARHGDSVEKMPLTP